MVLTKVKYSIQVVNLILKKHGKRKFTKLADRITNSYHLAD